MRERLQESWSDPPGQVYRIDDSLAVAGLQLGNVFVGVQPPRGFGENPIAIYHSPDLAPTHHYLAYYRWIREVFRADAMVHVGKHGTLEWLPGKGIGLSSSCYPEVALQDMPLFYPFIINNPGEGTQAKRRSHATIIDHLIPAMTTADSYGDIARLEQLMDEHYQCQTLDPAKLPILEKQIWDMVQQAQLHHDLGVESQPDDFATFLLEIDGYLCEIKDAQIKDGLHILGQAPKDEQLIGLLCALTRLDIFSPSVPSLRRALAESLGLDYARLIGDPGQPVDGDIPSVLVQLDSEAPVRSHGDTVERLEILCRRAYSELLARGFPPEGVAEVVSDLLGQPDPQTERVLRYVAETIYPALMRTTDEIGNLLRGLGGNFVPPGPSGAPTRGMANVLPTGRNFYSVDPKTIPSPAAWEVGQALAEGLLEKYLQEEGAYPEMVGIVVWGTSAMRTHGDDVAQILYLLGVRPVWQPESRRVQGMAVIPLEELGRPRIDVTIRISGFFRDAFPNLINHALGLSVACLQHDSAYMYDPESVEPPHGLKLLRQISRAQAYQADVTYGTNNEFGFDYLRDNMALDLSQRVQRELHYAIVDEVDNILIDEARTPLIISGPAEEPVELYYTFAKLAPRLQQEQDFTIDERTQAISLTQEGIAKMERWTKVGNLYEPENFHLVHYIENALTAHVMKKLDKDYVVRDGEVIIVDEFTGRLQFGRRWSDGLHQAVEAKEGLTIQRESITYATITLQNYFRMYQKLAGMTGTAATEADEFFKIYGLEVAVIPTHLPMIREDHSDLVFQTEEGKWRAVVKEIEEMNQAGRPVLVGTTSIEASERLSQRLKGRDIPHQVLNAKYHEQEAGIVAQAGRLGAVTVATNMAGRGTDIVLGGSETSRPDWQEEHQKVVQLGGLHVIGTEHHEARRIDNQLRGRSGRQGDPGSSRFYASLEDELLRRFGGDRIKAVMGWAGMDEDTPIENRLVTKSISNAQVKVESYHFDIRKHLLEFDDVLNKHREVNYTDRYRILAGDNLKPQIVEMVRQEFASQVRKHLSGQPDNWNVPGFLSELSLICPLPEDLADEDEVYRFSQEEIQQRLSDYAGAVYDAREREVGSEPMRLLERLLMLRTIDVHWVNHLTAMENLRTGIGLHAYGQRDPLVMYRTEGHKMFQDLLSRMQYDVVHTLFHVTVTQEPATNGEGLKGEPDLAKGSPMRAVNNRRRPAVAVGANKIGRNAPCPCGSGKKYKRCCGVNG